MWRLASDRNASGIILLNALDSKTGADGMYWPPELNATLEWGPLAVKLTSETSNIYEGLTIRDLDLSNYTKRGAAKKIRQWQITEWKDDSALLDGINLLRLVVDLVSRWQQDHIGPIIVQCMNGVERSGLFVALCLVLEKIKTDEKVDVGFAVKQLRQVRPLAVRSAEQYKVIHDIIADSLNESLAYYNA